MTRHRPLTSWPPYLPPADSLNAGNQLKFARPANLGSKSKVDSKVCRIDPFSKSAKKGNAFRCQESSRFWLGIWQNCGRSILRLLFWRLGLHDYCCHLVIGDNTVFSFQETSTCEIKEFASFCAFNPIFSHTFALLAILHRTKEFRVSGQGGGSK